MISSTLFAFSSYTKGLYYVTRITKETNHYQLEIKLPLTFQTKLNKKQQQFWQDLFYQ